MAAVDDQFDEELSRAFHAAFKAGDADAVHALWDEHGPFSGNTPELDIHWRDEDGNTPLLAAVMDPAALGRLLGGTSFSMLCRQDPNATNLKGESVLSVLRGRRTAVAVEQIDTLHVVFPTTLRRCALPGPFDEIANKDLVRACYRGYVAHGILDRSLPSLDLNYDQHQALRFAVTFENEDKAAEMTTVLLDRLGSRLDLVGFKPSLDRPVSLPAALALRLAEMQRDQDLAFFGLTEQADDHLRFALLLRSVAWMRRDDIIIDLLAQAPPPPTQPLSDYHGFAVVETLQTLRTWSTCLAARNILPYFRDAFDFDRTEVEASFVRLDGRMPAQALTDQVLLWRSAETLALYLELWGIQRLVRLATHEGLCDTVCWLRGDRALCLDVVRQLVPHMEHGLKLQRALFAYVSNEDVPARAEMVLQHLADRIADWNAQVTNFAVSNPRSFLACLCTNNSCSLADLARVLALVADRVDIFGRVAWTQEAAAGAGVALQEGRTAAEQTLQWVAHGERLPTRSRASALRLLSTAARRQIAARGPATVVEPILRPEALRAAICQQDPTLLAAALGYVHAVQSAVTVASAGP